MPEEFKSFLISVSIILAVALFLPCVESIYRIVRRHSRRRAKLHLVGLSKRTGRFDREAV